MDMEDQVDVWYQNRIHMAVSFTKVHVARTHELAAPIVTLGLWSNDWNSPQDGGGFSAIAASSNECDQMHMTGTLQRVIEGNRIAIEAIPYELAWGEVDSAEDLMSYQEPSMLGTI